MTTNQTIDGVPVAWRHTMHYEEGCGSHSVLTASPEHPFGIPDIDYDKTYRVTSDPLYAAQPAPVAPKYCGKMNVPLGHGDYAKCGDDDPYGLPYKLQCASCRDSAPVAVVDTLTPFEIEHDAEPGDEAAFREWRETRIKTKE